jgi:hypothetical protein
MSRIKGDFRAASCDFVDRLSFVARTTTIHEITRKTTKLKEPSIDHEADRSCLTVVR